MLRRFINIIVVSRKRNNLFHCLQPDDPMSLMTIIIEFSALLACKSRHILQSWQSQRQQQQSVRRVATKQNKTNMISYLLVIL